ncbi:stabilizer of axonemal microtubules 2-like isoform X2 [Stegostoma tigrinum]|uniref:stabilizer of axonemal microtubules 2-like isoform X2 n=1 Tax=Stegostoma tigrinum TaxID=3053191 RepID=UPI002870613E|nr:stabilizer of axonemal microtubules 2-like isoform X2 [Stegostoma tigrinum]
MKRKCICELCTCGRHQCPHLPTVIYEKINKPCLITEYVEKYTPYGDVQPRESYKPREEYQRHEGKMQSMTTFRADYTAHDIQPRPGRVSEEFKHPHGSMNLHTTYKRDFNVHSIQPVAPKRPLEQRNNSTAKMETIPTYKDHFKQWELPKKETYKPEYTFKVPSVKFANKTTFQDDYSFQVPTPRECVRPTRAARLLNVPFDDMTNYRQHFVPYTYEPRKRHEHEQYKPNDEPFDDLTTHRRDFKGQTGELTLPIRPPCSKPDSDQQFRDLTEFRDKYRTWTVDRPVLHKAVEFVSPEGTIDLSTTTRTDYIEHKVHPLVPARPVPQRSGLNISFEGQSTMKADYKPWDSVREPMIKPRQELEKATGQFNDMTTFRAHYVPHQINLVHSFKPRNSYNPNAVPLDNGTTYQFSFTPKPVQPCPASFTVPPGYEYVETDPQGHKLYRPLSEKENVQPKLPNTSLELISNTLRHQKSANDLKAGFTADGIVAA